MGSLLLILDNIVKQGEIMTVRTYGRKHREGGLNFNAFICLFAMVFFLVTDKNGLCFPPALIGYGLISCVLFASGFYFMYAALQCGSFIATKIINSFCLIIVIVYGAVFLGEEISVYACIAIVLFFISVFLINFVKAKDKKKDKVSVKWIVYVTITVLSSGFISVIQREQQILFKGAYDNEFMILSLFGAFLFLLTAGIIKEKNKMKYLLKNSMLYAFLAGLFNGGANFISLIIYNYIPISIAIPLTSGIGTLLSFAVAVFIYKEKFNFLQIIGVATGVLSIILFNI